MLIITKSGLLTITFFPFASWGPIWSSFGNFSPPWGIIAAVTQGSLVCRCFYKLYQPVMRYHKFLFCLYVIPSCAWLFLEPFCTAFNWHLAYSGRFRLLLLWWWRPSPVLPSGISKSSQYWSGWGGVFFWQFCMWSGLKHHCIFFGSCACWTKKPLLYTLITCTITPLMLRREL